MAGPKGGAKGAAAKSAEAKKAKDAAAAALAAAEESDDEEWVLDTTTPVVLDRRPPKTWKPAPLPDLPPVHEGRDADPSVGFDFDDPDSRRARVDEDAAIIARAKAIVDARESVGRKIAAGPYHGGARSRTTHWDYVLVEMRWMARDFAAERDWKLEAARRCGNASAAMRGKPVRYEPPEEESERRRAGAKVAREVARFWAAAWKRALRRPIPTAAELVPEPSGKGTTADARAGDHPDAGVPGGSPGTAAEDATTKGGAGAAVKGGESASLEQQHPSAANGGDRGSNPRGGGGDATEAADAGEEAAGAKADERRPTRGREAALAAAEKEKEKEKSKEEKTPPKAERAEAKLESAAGGGGGGGTAADGPADAAAAEAPLETSAPDAAGAGLLLAPDANGIPPGGTIRVSSPPRIHARSRAGSPRRRRRRPG